MKLKVFVLIIITLSITMECYTQDYLAAVDDGKNWGFINKKGDWIEKPFCSNLIAPGFNMFSAYDVNSVGLFFDGFAQYTSRGKFGFININGECYERFNCQFIFYHNSLYWL